MSATSPNLNLPYLQPSQAQKHVTHNLALQILDALAQLTVLGVEVSTPPVSPSEGDTWVLGSAPNGIWADNPRNVAIWTNGSWMYLPLRVGLVAYDVSSGGLIVFDGANWSPAVGTTAPDTWGINATADETNRLVVASEATLFTHTGAGHQMKLNKSAEGDTASLLYQTGFSGRAEMGLAGTDNWSLKVSGDGVAWATALEIDATTAAVSGDSVQQSAGDTGVGKLARADFVYGPGNLVGAVSENAGAPTGAVIETGSSASGTYTRFADGTQICQISDLTLVQVDADHLAQSWTFPVQFSSAPTVSLTLPNDGVDYSDLGPTNLAQSTADWGLITTQLRIYRGAGAPNLVSSAAVANVRATAIGRWF